MRIRVAVTAAAVLAAGLVHADTDVRRNGDKVDVHAATAPITEVLDRLARQTGMKVIYDGPQPRARVRLELTGVTPLQAVLSLMEGQGLNYALRMDATGTRIDTLLLVAGGGASTPAPMSPPRPDVQRMFEREQPEPPPEPEEPAEVPAQANVEEKAANPISGLSSGPIAPAMPLMLPTPPPAAAEPGKAPGGPAGGLILPPSLPSGVVPSPAPQD